MLYLSDERDAEVCSDVRLTARRLGGGSHVAEVWIIPKESQPFTQLLLIANLLSCRILILNCHQTNVFYRVDFTECSNIRHDDLLPNCGL
jgi:hypothetical protein